MDGYRQANLDWFANFDCKDWYAVTLNLEQSLPDVNGERCRLTEQVASRNLRHYINILEKRFYGNAARRYGKHLEIIPTFEYAGKNKRYLHYHAHIKRPAHIPEWKFENQLRNFWFKTEWGTLNVLVVKHADKGWLKYITKETKGWSANPEWNFENIDFLNIRFAG